MRQFQTLTLFRAQPAVSRHHVFDWAQHQGERSSELVAYIAEEECFRAIQLGERCVALLLFFKRTRRSDRTANMSESKLQKCLVIGIQTLPGIYPDERESIRHRFVRRNDGQYHAGGGRIWPWVFRQSGKSDVHQIDGLNTAKPSRMGEWGSVFGQ